MTENNVKHNKIALIVEGGGFKSSFTAGILDVLIKYDFSPFDLYIGVSGGAMNLTSYLSRQYKRNINIILSMSENTNFISIVRFLKGGHYLELRYLHDVIIKKYPYNYIQSKKFLQNADCKVVVTNYITGVPNYLSVKEYGWIKTMEATGSLPIATRGYCEINGKKYIDGGLSDPLPIQKVYDWGYRNIVLLRTYPKDIEPDWKLETLYAPLFFRDNPKLQKLIINNDKIYAKKQKFILEPPSDLNLIQISPYTDLNCGVIANTIENVKMDYRHGLEMGLDALNDLKKIESNCLK